MICSYSDCPAVCPSTPTIPLNKGPLKVALISLGIFIGIIGFGIYNIVFVIFVL